MPSENLDMVRSIYLGWERGDFNSAAWADPDIEYLVVDGPEPGRRNGLAGMAEGWRDWLRAWEDFRAEPEKYIDLGDERILVLVRNSGRGRVSGLELDQRSGANLFELHDGMVVRLVIYLERDHAFADLGLTPETDAADSP
jgi:ketosteroid isomerase-like protein